MRVHPNLQQLQEPQMSLPGSKWDSTDRTALFIKLPSATAEIELRAPQLSSETDGWKNEIVSIPCDTLRTAENLQISICQGACQRWKTQLHLFLMARSWNASLTTGPP
jgi:hypothetical protein